MAKKMNTQLRSKRLGLKPTKIKNEKVENDGVGLFGQALGFQDSFGLLPFGEQVESPATLFKNLRYYLVSNYRLQLSQAYAEIGLIQTIIDIPVDDAFRGGIGVKTKQLGEEEIRELTLALDRDDDLTTVARTLKWARLFGGGATLILTKDQDPATPLDIASINKDSSLEFRSADMWELFFSLVNIDDGENDPSFQTIDVEYYNYYGRRIHHSRVLPVKGRVAPSFIRPRLRGWGLSEIEILIRSINQYLKATNVGFEVLDEFKVDYYMLKGLVNSLMSPQGMQSIQKRIQLMNMSKNYKNAVVLGDEDKWEQKQLSFAGLADTMAGIRQQVCADMRMPASKLFGQSFSTGLGNSDQNDMENYNSMVESSVRTPCKSSVLKIVELKCQFLFGMIPDDLEIEFKPLRVLSAVDEETVKTQKFTRLQGAMTAGTITLKEFRESANKGNLFDIHLDTTDAALADVEAEAPDEDTEGEAGEAGKGTQDELGGPAKNPSEKEDK